MARSGPETRLLNAARKAAQAKYGERLVIVKYHGSEFGEAGVSDTLCCLDGQFLAVEFKAPDGKHPVTVKQRAFGDRVLRAGGAFAVVRSIEEFLDVLAAVETVTQYENPPTDRQDNPDE